MLTPCKLVSVTVKGLDTACFTLHGSSNDDDSSKSVKKKNQKEQAYPIYDIYKVK